MGHLPGSAFRGAGKAWEVKFAGEEGIDAGGPYRESIGLMITDLQAPMSMPGRLPLLVPVPNKDQSDATGRGKWHPNPRFAELRRGDEGAALFSWLGKLLGIALRTLQYKIKEYGLK